MPRHPEGAGAPSVEADELVAGRAFKTPQIKNESQTAENRQKPEPLIDLHREHDHREAVEEPGQHDKVVPPSYWHDLRVLFISGSPSPKIFVPSPDMAN